MQMPQPDIIMYQFFVYSRLYGVLERDTLAYKEKPEFLWHNHCM